MRYLFLMVIISYYAFGDWSSDDSSHLSSINRYVTDFYNGAVSSSGWQMGWCDYSKNQWLATRELADAKEYRWGTSEDVGGSSTMYEENPFSSRNKTMFDQNNLAQENQPYYEDYIFSYFPSIYSYTWDNSIPDKGFLSAPASGDLMNKIVTEMNNAGFGISNIATSQQTSEIRAHVQLAENSLDGMFNCSNYSNSVINWDLSSLGQIFVDRNIMSANPFMNLRGTFRIVPSTTDFHYKIWYDYFREGSTFGNIIRTCVTAMVFFLVLIYVINDIMSIVDA